MSKCALCKTSIRGTQMQLDMTATSIVEFCQACKMRLEIHVAIIGDGWAALVEDECFREHIQQTIPDDRIFKMTKSQAEKIAEELAKTDEDYIRSLAGLQNLYEEIDYHECEAAVARSQAEDIKKELLDTKSYYFGEIFKTVKVGV